MDTMDKLRKQLNDKRAAFRAFDALPKEEQAKRRIAGMDPHEPKELRERKKKFNRLPKEQRDIRTALGWNPHRTNQIIRRTTGDIRVL